MNTIAPTDIPDYLVSRGRIAATTEELCALTGQSKKSLSNTVGRLERSGRVVSPAKGLYVMVPAEYRAFGTPPVDWYIDAMMRHLRRDYYVSFMTGASAHGATHQAGATYQVVVSAPLASRVVGRVRFTFVSSAHVSGMDTVEGRSETGTYRLGARETVAVDLVWRPEFGAGLGNVAALLTGLGELDGDRLARMAEIRGHGVARRLGWLIQRVGSDVDTHWLARLARAGSDEPTNLAPGGHRTGRVDPTWRIRLNVPFEVDR